MTRVYVCDVCEKVQPLNGDPAWQSVSLSVSVSGVGGDVCSLACLEKFLQLHAKAQYADACERQRRK